MPVQVIVYDGRGMDECLQVNVFFFEVVSFITYKACIRRDIPWELRVQDSNVTDKILFSLTLCHDISGLKQKL